MLILSRKCGESLIINDQIEVKVTEIAGDKVKIGIAAPHDYKILRKELRQTMESNKQAASGVMSKEMKDFISHIEEKEK